MVTEPALGLRDISRADLITSAGEAFFLEVNVTPEMSETSTLPMALGAAGRGPGTVCRGLLGQAAARGTRDELCPCATRGYFHAAKRGLPYVANVHTGSVAPSDGLCTRRNQGCAWQRA